MLCKFCGEEMEKDAVFCGMCGRRIGNLHQSRTAAGIDILGDSLEDLERFPERSRHEPSQSRYRRKQHSPMVPFLCGIGSVVFVGGLLFLLWSHLKPSETAAPVMGVPSSKSTESRTEPTEAIQTVPASTDAGTASTEASKEETTVATTQGTVPSATEPQITEPVPNQYEFPLTGYVKESSGGLNVRSGPGVAYEKLGALKPNEKVVIQEAQLAEGAWWGRIGVGRWVCMDYLLFPGDIGYPPTSIPEAYIPILRNYRTAINHSYNYAQLEAVGLNPYLEYDTGSGTIGYYLIDLDGNGIKEMLIGATGEYTSQTGRFYDLYTIVNGSPVRMVTGIARSEHYLCTNGSIANEASGGASYIAYHYYRFDPNARQGLNLIETVIRNGMYEYDYLPVGSGPWYYTMEDVRILGEDIRVVPLSDTDAAALRSYYAYARIPYLEIPEY